MISNSSGPVQQHKTKLRDKWKQTSHNTYDDIIKKKKKKIRIWIVFQNISRLMIDDETIDKRELVREFINKYNIYFYALAEVNIN